MFVSKVNFTVFITIHKKFKMCIIYSTGMEDVVRGNISNPAIQSSPRRFSRKLKGRIPWNICIILGNFQVYEQIWHELCEKVPAGII